MINNINLNKMLNTKDQLDATLITPPDLACKVPEDVQANAQFYIQFMQNLIEQDNKKWDCSIHKAKLTMLYSGKSVPEKM